MMNITDYIIDIKGTSLEDRLKLKQTLLNNGQELLKNTTLLDMARDAKSFSYTKPYWSKTSNKADISLQDFITKFGKQQLLHQQWKDLHYQGVELEFKHTDSLHWKDVTRSSKASDFFTASDREFRIKQQPKYELHNANFASDYDGWYVVTTNDCNLYLNHSLQVVNEYDVDEYTLIWPTEAEANLARAQYLGEQMEPEIKVGSHWERVTQKVYLDNIICIDSVSDTKVTWCDFNKTLLISDLLKNFKPRPDLDKPTVCNTQPQSTTKEQPMNKLDLRLLTAIMAALATAEDEQLDATNSEFICVLTKDNNYEGYFYSNSVEDCTEVMQKVENAEKKLHVFKYQSTVAQKPRKIIEVERSCNSRQ